MRTNFTSGAARRRSFARLPTVSSWLWLVCALVVPVEAGRAKLGGTVVDSAGRPLGGATVTVVAGDTDLARSETNAKGRFQLAVKLSEGDYVVRIEKSGFLEVGKVVRIQPGVPLDISVSLMTESEAAGRAAELAEAERREGAARLYNEGATAYNSGDSEAALRLLGQAVEVDPELAIAWGALARIRLETEAWEEAVEAAQRLVALQPEEVPLLLLYDAYWGAGDGDRAAALAERLRREFPGPGIAARLANAGVSAVRGGDLETGREHFEAALAVDAGLHQARLPLAEVLRDLDELEPALEQLVLYLESEPASERAHLLRVEILRDLGRTAEADRALDELKAVSPGAAVWLFFDEGVRHFSSGRPEQAIRALHEALAIEPDHARSHFQLGLVHASLGHLAEARRELETFVSLAPEDPEAMSARRMIEMLE